MKVLFEGTQSESQEVHYLRHDGRLGKIRDLVREDKKWEHLLAYTIT